MCMFNIEEKVLKRLRKEQEMDIKEFKKAISFIRLDSEDANLLIKSLKEDGLIETEKTQRGLKIKLNE